MLSVVTQQSIVAKNQMELLGRNNRIVQILKVKFGMDCIGALTEVKRQFLSGL